MLLPRWSILVCVILLAVLVGYTLGVLMMVHAASTLVPKEPPHLMGGGSSEMAITSR